MVESNSHLLNTTNKFINNGIILFSQGAISSKRKQDLIKMRHSTKYATLYSNDF